MYLLNFRVNFTPFAFLILVTNLACRPKPRILTSPPHYNFSNVYTDKLDLKLQEISGIAWDSKANIFYAINDEAGKLFVLDKESKAIKGEYNFGEKGDYEDVAVHNGIPYILRSDGKIIKFITDSSGKGRGIEAGKIKLSGSNDFETLYSDPDRNALIMICKTCKSDEVTTISAFAFYPDSTGFDEKPIFVIDAAKINQLSPFKTSKFQPSAAAIHPVLHKLFILSSTSGQLVVADLNGNVKSVHQLSKSLFLQPEGIAFKQGGDMYISNEGLGKKATLLKFTYISQGDTSKEEYKAIGYDFSLPDDKMKLDKHLKEISGMAYIPGTNLILAENDEKGDIYTIDFENKKDKVGKIKFGGKEDYEDIVYTEDAIYMLISSGTIVRVQTKDSSFATKEFKLEKEKNEFESMYLDADKKSLILLCKDCRQEKNEIRTAYRFDLATMKFLPEPAYTIQIDEIKKILNDDEAEFKPSAAGISPVDGKLYIIASVGKLLVIVDKKGKVEKAVRLDPKLYNQPEGMTFAPNGDLYISNERGEEENAVIYKFIYKK